MAEASIQLEKSKPGWSCQLSSWDFKNRVGEGYHSIGEGKNRVDGSIHSIGHVKDRVDGDIHSIGHVKDRIGEGYKWIDDTTKLYYRACHLSRRTRKFD